MSSKDIKTSTKTSLMDELKSIKGVLNSDDDNIPLLLDDNDIPVLAGDDDIPVLTSPDDIAAASNKASLDAAMRQLESMELSPRSNKARTDKSVDLEEQIRTNAAPPLFDDPNATTVRENPFLAKKPTDRFAESRKQAEEALKSVIAHSKAMSNPAKPGADAKAPMAIKDNPSETPIEFSDNQFLAASSAQPKPNPVPVPPKQSPHGEDASAEILKLLNEEPAVTADPDLDLDLGDEFGELVDIDVDALINEKPVTPKTISSPASPGKKTDAQINDLIDEVINEYMVILEVALRKKLKEKLPDILKR